MKDWWHTGGDVPKHLSASWSMHWATDVSGRPGDPEDLLRQTMMTATSVPCTYREVLAFQPAGKVLQLFCHSSKWSQQSSSIYFLCTTPKGSCWAAGSHKWIIPVWTLAAGRFDDVLREWSHSPGSPGQLLRLLQQRGVKGWAA